MPSRRTALPALPRLVATASLVLASTGVSLGDEAPKPPGAVRIANPASVACVERGGRSEIRTERDGGQAGYCHLPDGRICAEWPLFRDGTCVLPPR